MVSTKESQPRVNQSQRSANLFIRVGILLLVIGLIVIVITLYPVIKLEIEYLAKTQQTTESTLSQPNWPNHEFAIFVPKIDAISAVVENVNPYNSNIYQQALTKGVAHAAGTGVPGGGQNIFIFSHSSVNFFEANKYNSVFYLLHKLEQGDEIQVYYQDTLHKYIVDNTALVSPTRVEYLTTTTNQETLTLMTCWPPGTTSKRLVIVAKLSDPLLQ